MARGKGGGGKHSAAGGGWWWWLGELARWLGVRLENEVSGCGGKSGGSCCGRGGEPINISRKVCDPLGGNADRDAGVPHLVVATRWYHTPLPPEETRCC